MANSVARSMKFRHIDLNMSLGLAQLVEALAAPTRVSSWV